MKVRNYDYIVTLTNGQNRVFRTWSTAEFFRKSNEDKVVNFERVLGSSRSGT